MRLIQITHPDHGRKVALVREPSLVLLDHMTSVYELATEAIHSGKDISAMVEKYLSDSTLEYDSVYDGASEWTLLPSFDCPKNVFSCLVSGRDLRTRTVPSTGK